MNARKRHAIFETLQSLDPHPKTELEYTIELLEPLNCCVAPVLTPAEAAQHPLFAPELYTSATAAEQDDYANNTGDSAIPQEWSGAKTVKGYES